LKLISLCRLFHDPVYRGERILGSPRRHARNGLALLP
jgi:hypothetical protein